MGLLPVSVAPVAVTSIGSTPAPHSWVTCPTSNIPRRLAVTAAPTLGCPANGNSSAGVKMRARYVAPTWVGGSTNTVSDRLNSSASACICSVASASAPNTTASGLPLNGRSVKTSTIS